MLDQLAPGRFEFGTGRGSSSVEVLGFGIDSMDTTRDMFDEALPEIVKMMGPDEYGPYEGEYFSLPRRQVLPKPVTLPHPPIWVAAGSPGTFEKAARMGIGVLCFSFAGAEALKPLIEIYKNTIEDAEPVGGYVNNNVMVTTAMMMLEDGDRAREVFRNNQTGYHTSLVAKYLDSFPQAAGIDKAPTLTPPIPLEQVNKRDRDGCDRGGHAGRGDQHHAGLRGDRCRPGLVRRACPTTRRSTPPSSRSRRSASTCCPSSTRTRSTRPRASARRSSARRPFRRALLEERADSLLRVGVGCIGGNHRLHELVGIGFGAFDLVVERALAEADHPRAETHDLLDERVDRRVELLDRHHLVDQAPIERGAGVDRLTREQHLQQRACGRRLG